MRRVDGSKERGKINGALMRHACPADARPMAVRYRLKTIAASLALLLGSSLPLNAQPKPPEVTVANPVLKRIAQWDEYTGQFEAVRRVEVRARVSGELVKIHFSDGQTVKGGRCAV
jgi:multidrug efflux pump subunit AcrA (membrane-fusion protein)